MTNEAAAEANLRRRLEALEWNDSGERQLEGQSDSRNGRYQVLQHRLPSGEGDRPTVMGCFRDGNQEVEAHEIPADVVWK